MKTRTYSTIANATPITGATSLAVGPGQAVDIVSIEGYCYGVAGSQVFLQLVNTATPTSGVTVPLWSRQINQAQGFSFVYEDPQSTANMTVPSNNGPVYVFLSSTNETCTDGVAFNCDVDVTIEEFEQQVDFGQSTATATNAGNVVVWSDDYAAPNNPPHTSYNLLTLTITNNTGAPIFPMVFTSTGQATAGATPLRQLGIPGGSSASVSNGSGGYTGALATGQSYTWRFGGDGSTFLSADATGAFHGGCYIYASSTTGVLTTVANGVNFSANYDTGVPI